jgi:predicted KAP-like P-loop ATPase
VPAKRNKPKPHTEFSADRPIDSVRADRLGRKGFADGLAKRIQAWRGRDSLVIALCGEWGCGKTSLKNMVVERLRGGKAVKVDLLEFNPWQISGHDSLTAAFFRELAAVLGSDRSDKASSSARVAKLRAYATLAALGATAMKWFGKAARVSGEDCGAALEAGGSALAQVGQVAGQGADAQEAGDRAREKPLAELKRSLAKDMAALERPVLIVIDDIDRLTSDEIREVFQLVKANADFPNLIYLLMFDRDIVSGALDAIANGRGHDFLDKIVQVLLHVPQPSLKDVRQVLFEGLDARLAEAGVSERWDSQRWSRLWLEGLAGYFTNLRSVYRFLGSFGFHVSQMRNGRTFELNPVDLIALETLRLFEPAFYEAIPSNRASFVGEIRRQLFSRQDDDKKERNAELERVLSGVPAETRSRVRGILEQLFPALFGHQHPDHHSLLRDLRVGHESIFDRYFTLSLSSDDVSQADLDALRQNIANTTEFAGVCASLARRGKLETAFERLDAYNESFPASVFPAAITTLADVGDSLPWKDDYHFIDFKFDPLTYAWRLIYFGLKRIEDEGRRFELLRDGITTSRGVQLAVQIVSSQERVGNRSEHDFLINEEHCAALKLVALERLSSAASDGRLRGMSGIGRLLWRWHDWAGEAEVRKWIAGQLRNGSDALWFLRTFLSELRKTSDRVVFIRYINLKNIGMFADAAVIEALTRDLKIEELDKDDQRALRAFRQALIWKAEGKPDGYNGDDWRTANPLAEES